MEVLVRIHRSPERRFLINVSDKKLIKEIRNLLKKNKRSKAIVAALAKGRSIVEVSAEDLPNVKADLIITEEYVSRDLALHS